jgi:hypothetical protein
MRTENSRTANRRIVGQEWENRNRRIVGQEWDTTGTAETIVGYRTGTGVGHD